MIQGIDHLVILVHDLDQATKHYQALGFTVTPGGKHPRGTHNALVSFKDGAYLELIAFWEPDYSEHRWHPFLATEGGLIDHALATDDLAVEISGAATRGVPYEGPVPGARKRPDGKELEWRLAHERVGAGHGLPFLIEDVSDRSLRVPGGEATDHENGALGIDRLIIAVNDLERIGSQYAALVDTDPESGDLATELDQPTNAIVVQAGRDPIEIHQPIGAGPMTDQLEQRGNGPYAAVLYGSQERDILPKQAGNARISLIVR